MLGSSYNVFFSRVIPFLQASGFWVIADIQDQILFKKRISHLNKTSRNATNHVTPKSERHYKNFPTLRSSIFWISDSHFSLLTELGFGTVLVPQVSVFGTWKRAIRFRYIGTFLKRVIRYGYFGTVLQYFRKKIVYVKEFKTPLMPFNIFLSPYKTYSKPLNTCISEPLKHLS